MHPTTKYAYDVINKDIIAGQLVILACERHIKDLKRVNKEEFPYVFSEEKANDIIDFYESLRYTDGDKDFKGKLVQLPEFAKFILGSIFGWVNKDTGYRRFKKSYVQVARKNIKSMLNSGKAIYMAGFDGYENAQVYTAATKMQQARIVWGQAAKYINQEPDLLELHKIKEHDAIIENKINGGKIIALGRDTKTIDGFDPHCGIIDEYHAHKDEQVVKLLEDGAVNQKQSLISIITTAGFDLNGPCYEEYEYCCNLLKGGFENEEYFCYIAQMDKEDDIWDPLNWIKANPLVATLPQGMENLKRFAKEAEEKGGETLRNFMTKSLNIWIQQADNQYINVEEWKSCGSDATLEDMKGKECVVGLDLSSGGDLTSTAFEFRLSENKYFVDSHSFMPSRRLQEHIMTDKAPYDMWAKEGLLTITETLGGVKTDYKYIIQYLKEVKERYKLKYLAIAYDPHNASAFLDDLEQFGCPLIEITQSARNLNDATQDFRLEVKAGNITYNKKNKLLTWSMINAKTISNSFGEIKIEKDFRTKRIDPVDAVIDAHKIAMTNSYSLDITEVTNEYLDMMGW